MDSISNADCYDGFVVIRACKLEQSFDELAFRSVLGKMKAFLLVSHEAAEVFMRSKGSLLADCVCMYLSFFPHSCI